MDLSAAHLHLLLNHVPIFAFAFGLLLLAWGRLRGSDEVVRAVLGLFLLAGVVAVFFSLNGKAAADTVEAIAGVSHDTIEAHEEAGKTVMIVSIVIGLLSGVGIARFREQAPPKWLVGMAAVGGLVALGFLSYPGFLGGQIQHVELRTDRGASSMVDVPGIAADVLHPMVIPSRADTTGAALYRTACAGCHGMDGTGVSQERLVLDVPIPDFTDCSFASREPDGDWGAVVHAGGPVRGFSDAMPAFGEALDAEEIADVLAYVRTFCGDDEWPAGELNLPRALVTEKAYPEDEAVFTIDAAADGPGAWWGEAVYETRIGARSQIELVIPIGYRERAGAGLGWAGGLGDVAVAFKRDMHHNLAAGRILSLAAELILPTGDRANGFGTGTTVFEPFVSFGQILPADAFFQAQAGLELPVDTDRAEREGFWRMALGRTWAEGPNGFGRAWSPMVEVLAGRELSSNSDTSWDVLPQFQVTLNTRQHIMVNFGVRIPVTDASERPTRFVAYLLWDWFDGGFLEGW